MPELTEMECASPMCPSHGYAVEVDLTPIAIETGEPLVVADVYCGSCSTPIVDVVPGIGE
jgi:hypothetical protein